MAALFLAWQLCSPVQPPSSTGLARVTQAGVVAAWTAPGKMGLGLERVAVPHSCHSPSSVTREAP